MALTVDIAGKVFAGIAFIFGANVGSFLNVVIYRLPRSCVTVNNPRRSFCPICRRQLKWHENLPLLGWLLLRGKCGGCKLPISFRYPLFEFVTGLLWLLAALRFLQPPQIELPAFLITVAFLSLIVVAAMIDIDLRILPDKITLPAMALLPIGCFFVPSLLPGPDLPSLANKGMRVLEGPLSWWGSETLVAIGVAPMKFLMSLDAWPWLLSCEAMLASLAGLIIGAAFVWGIASFGRLAFGREVMGFGDVKYMGMIGAYVGVFGSFQVILIACVLGSLGGLLWKLAKGRSSLSQQRYFHELGPIGQLLLRPFRKEDIDLESGEKGFRYRGLGALMARMLTGDNTIPFGPSLSIGAILVVLYPNQLETLFLDWWPALLHGGS